MRSEDVQTARTGSDNPARANSSGPLRIAMVHDYQPNLGGTTEIVIRLARALRKRGHACKLITHPESWVRDGDKETVELVYAPKFKITFMQYIPHNCAKVAKIVSLNERGRIELCHAHYALPYGLVGYLAKQACGIPYIVTLHGSDIHILASMPSLKPVMKLCLENADAVTSVCGYLKLHAAKKLGVKEPIAVIPNFVDVARFRPNQPRSGLRKEFDIRPGEAVVTHVSNYAAIKNTLIIPHIAKLVLQKHRRTVFLMVGQPLGETGFHLKELKKKVASLGLKGHFRFPGRRDDIARIFSISDMSLLTSSNEAAPLAALESLAVGVPVVSSRVGGVPEFIRHGVSGFLVERNRIERYAKFICTLLENNILRAKMGRNGVAVIHEKYCENAVVSQYEHLYESVLRSRHGEDRGGGSFAA